MLLYILTNSYQHKITYLLCTYNGRKNVKVYSPNTYGVDTWGSTSQDSIEKKRKYWYICSWTNGNEWFDDIIYEDRLNVILETQDIKKLFKYVEEKYPQCLDSVKDDCESIKRLDEAIMSWCN